MKKILALGAHYDDIEIGAAGTLYQHVLSGDIIYFAVINSDEYRTGDSNVRYAEQLKSLEIFNIPKEHLLCFNSTDVESDVIGKLDNLNVDSIFCHYEKDTHQDHRKCSIIGQAVGRNKKITTFFYSSGSAYDFYPNAFSIIDFDVKTKLINCFTTQIDRSALQFNIIKKKESYWGSLVSNDPECYAEGFIVRKIIHEV